MGKELDKLSIIASIGLILSSNV